MSEPRVQQYFLPMEGHLLPGPSSLVHDSPSDTPPSSDPADLLRLIAEANVHGGYGIPDSPKTQLDRLMSGVGDIGDSFPQGIEVSAFGMPADFSHFTDFSVAALRNSSKTLKCPKCNWHYKYQETLEIHMKEKHSEGEVKCMFCVENRPHPKLSRGESYSCGYKPYRCELCRYSTTTKGNLSIHMQSDKHLHAMQELPNSIASLGCQRTTRSPVQDGENAFVCLVCGCFSCDSLHEMINHAEKDRGRPSSSDVSLNGGIFRCHLCPYHTNLKANFQLHTRTDKHLQRVQLVNHIREGANAASALCRLGAAKSVFQVLCRPCQEILPTGAALREHCEGVGHRTNLRQPLTVFRCRLCSFETQLKHEAFGHMAVHEAATWPSDKIELDAMAVDEDAAFGCASCGFTAKDANTLEEHARSHEEGEPCPLCNDRTTTLNEHLIQEHKISESAVEKLLQVHRVDPIGGSTHTFRCSRCQMAFRSEAALHSHSVLHLFDMAQKCTHCSKVCSTAEELKSHVEAEHAREEETRCDLCNEAFTSRSQYMAHINSVRHLHEAKKQLEAGSVSLNQQVLSALQNPTSPGEKKPFRCNVCKIGYGQGATLDIHLRSVAHQSRMNKLGELVASKEVDPTRPVLEQPGGAPQKLIRELLGKDEEATTTTAASQQSVMNVFNLMNMFMGQNPMGMAFGTPPAAEEEEMETLKTAADLLSMLKTFGIDRITAACPEILLKLGKLTAISDDQISQLCKVDCTECGQTHSSIVTLGVHCQETHSSALPEAVLRRFCDRLLSAAGDSSPTGHDSPATTSRDTTRDNSEPPEKRPRSGPTPPEKPDLTQMAMLGMMTGGFNPFMQANPFMAPSMQDFFNPLLAQQLNMGQSPAKRARTRISDDQLKILRQYFDINNSPSEAQIKEMSIKAGLPEKVIKHWFRNTLFKERQRDKDSPYNFSVPPQVGIDMDAYDKTGETKVVPLTPEVKAEIKSEPSPVEKRPEPSLPQLNLATMMQQMQQTPFSFMDPMLHGQLPQLPQQSSTTGRRANRTRFTDFQLRTLQQFFDKQAYPKDDDLELLSKKLQLSPRVIVVWFQNARQKARKIYENQPNHENNDRFLRTPGCNFQCKRCNLVFQRYYELIQHQQKVCYKDDGLALANDNKGVEEGLTEDEKALAQTATSSEVKPSPADLLKLLGGGKSSTEALLRMCESANIPSTANYNKRCPFCALLFKSKTAMVEHLSMKHAQQMLFSPLDPDSLPDAEDVPVLTCSDQKELPGVIDLSSAGQERESLSMSPFLAGQSDGDDFNDFPEDSSTLASLVASATPGSARSPVSNKRYRTHLTPVQVHVMKSVFTDYKTPSMSECESLGRDIGLHKRVVQVWFQNARAKERKNRASNGENEDVFRSTATGCTLCGVDYIGRMTMQDHLFGQQHMSALKSQTKAEGNISENIHENGSDRLKASALLKPSKAQLGAVMNGFPFQFMNGMMNPTGLPLMFDQSLFGVPVTVLQVPDEVKEQIKSDMAAGQSKSRFTHDGESVSALKETLSSEDASCLTEEDEEVGWGCPACSNVFQMEQHLKTHQQQFCRASETFTLVQTHYGCSVCSSRFGSQREFQTHLSSAEHQTRVGASCSS